MKPKLTIIILIFILVITGWLFLDWWIALPQDLTANYVGRQTCTSCHNNQNLLWQQSDHDLAMDLATEEFVVGDFNNITFEHHGITSRMFTKEGRYFVETEGPDGKQAEFEVKYVIGYRPLQQYMAELEKGDIQVLPVSCDTEKKEWFFANPDKPFGPSDPLHWTGSAQNWNHMCAECHTTNYAKNFDLKTKTYHSTFNEMDVSCESCHGPGSIHVKIANSSSVFWDRHHGYGLAQLKGENPKTELETCAPCHSRRRRLKEGFHPGDRYDDFYQLSLLEENLYHADGQINEEVYVYGSFLQSMMHRKGVRCTNCHDPHTTRLKFKGNRLCTQCHVPAKYDTPSHHHHKVESKGALCVECHMPDKKFMVVDPRRDHSLRVPRPDLTVSIGTPNACNQCHKKEKETAQWASNAVEKWYGTKRRETRHYGEIIADGRSRIPHAESELIALAKDRKNAGSIVRATAISILATSYSGENVWKAIQKAFKDRDPIVRTAATRFFENMQPNSQEEAEQFKEVLFPLLNDVSRSVRVEATRLCTSFPTQMFSKTEQKLLDLRLKEYKATLKVDNDQSGSHMGLGILYHSLGNIESTIHEYEIAKDLEPALAGPRSNLAQIFEGMQKPEKVKKLRQEELELLKRDSKLLPDNAPIHYRLGLLYYLLSDLEHAEGAISQAVKLAPSNPEFRYTLTLLYEKTGKMEKAKEHLQKLIRLQPENRVYRQMEQKFKQSR